MTGRRRKDYRYVVDDKGRVLCQKCGEFKPPAEMVPYAANHRLHGEPSSLCRACIRERKRGYTRSPARGYSAAALLRRQRMDYARCQAAILLRRRHRGEYERLVAEIYQDLADREIVDFIEVRAHTRARYAPAHVNGVHA